MANEGEEGAAAEGLDLDRREGERGRRRTKPTPDLAGQEGGAERGGPVGVLGAVDSGLRSPGSSDGGGGGREELIARVRARGREAGWIDGRMGFARERRVGWGS